MSARKTEKPSVQGVKFTLINQDASVQQPSITHALPDNDFTRYMPKDIVDNADQHWTTQPDQPVKLRMTESGSGSEPPITIPTYLMRTVKQIPTKPAMVVKRNGQLVSWTYSEYMRDALRAAKGLIRLGLEPTSCVIISGLGAPEWILSHVGAIFAGGFPIGLPFISTAEDYEKAASKYNVSIIIVDNDLRLEEVNKIRHRLPNLRAIVQYNGTRASQFERVYSWTDLMALGNNKTEDADLQKRMKQLVPNKCCMIVYTSGTTGNSKGVMLSHDNITWQVDRVVKHARKDLGRDFGKVRIMSFLPLHHIGALILDIYIAIGLGSVLHFAKQDALSGSLIDSLREIRPHIFLCLPKFWRDIQEAIERKLSYEGSLKKSISKVVMEKNLKDCSRVTNRRENPKNLFTWFITNGFVCKSIKKWLGLDKCSLYFSAADNIEEETLKFFFSVNVKVCNAYGASELAGPHCLPLPSTTRIPGVGKEMPGCKLMVDDETKEILASGRNIFMGYLHDEDKTSLALDNNGFYCTGDIGRVDEHGDLHIIGRKSEFIHLSNNVTVSPVEIENAVKCPLHNIISHCMLVGENRPFLCMLITLKTEVNQENQVLTPMAKQWCRASGSQSETVADILKGDQAVNAKIQEVIDNVNQTEALANTEIRKWAILSEDFTLKRRELSSTLKMRRQVIQQNYEDRIDSLYQE